MVKIKHTKTESKIYTTPSTLMFKNHVITLHYLYISNDLYFDIQQFAIQVFSYVKLIYIFVF